MKKLIVVSAVLGIFLGSWGLARATSTFITQQGGTGTTSPSGILYGDNGSSSHLNTVKIGTNCTFSGGTLNCSASGSGNVSTSTHETSGYLAYWTSNSATPALLGKIATSTLTATSPLTGSFTHVGVAGSLGCQTASGSQAGCLSSTDWNTFNNKQATISATYPLAISSNIISTHFGTTTTWGMGNNGIIMTSATGIPFSKATSSPIALDITGNAGTATALQNARTIGGVSFNGTANISLTSGSSILKGNGSGGFSNASNGTDYTLITAKDCTSGGQFLQTVTAAGVFTCATPSGGGTWPFTPATNYGVSVQSTTTPLWLKTPVSGHISLMASSTAVFDNATTTLLSVSTSGTHGSALTVGKPTTPLTSSTLVQYADEDGSHSDWSFKVAGVGYPAINFGASGGTLESPATTTASGGLFLIDGYAYSGGAYRNLSEISSFLYGTPTLTSTPTDMYFDVTGAGQTNKAPMLSLQGGLDQIKLTDAVVSGKSAILKMTGLGGSDRTFYFPALTGSFALGSYTTGFLNGSVPFGSSGLLATSSALTFSGSTLHATYASTTAVSGTSVCIGSTCKTSWPSGTVTSVALSDANSTLTIGGSPITTSGTLTATFNLAHANTWSALQTFGNASTTQLSAASQKFYVAPSGEITGYDTTYSHSGQVSPLRPITLDISTSTTWTGTSTTGSLYGDMAAGVIPYTGTITKASCFTNTGTLVVELTSGSNSTYLTNASTTAGINTFSLSIAKGDKFYLQAGHAASSAQRVNCTFMGWITP